MKTFLTLFLFSSGMLFTATDISMQSVKINDPASVLKKIKLKVEATEEHITKYRTDNDTVYKKIKP